MHAMKPVLSAVLGALLLGGCAGLTGSPGTVGGYRVVPVQRMSGMDDPEAWYQRGRYFLGQGRLSQAEQSLRKAIVLNPEHAEARNALAVVLVRSDAREEAEREFRKAMQLAPEEAHIRANFGRFLSLVGRQGEALVALEDAALIDPDNAAIRASLDSVRQNLGRPVRVAKPESMPLQKPASGRDAPSGASGAVVVIAPVAPQGPNEPRGLPVVVSRTARENAVVVVVPPVPAGDPRSPVRQISASSGGANPAIPLAVLGYAAPAAPQATAVKRLENSDAKHVAEAGAPVVAPASASVAPRESAEPSRQPRLEVANGNGVEGMARRVRTVLQGEGYARVRVTNQQPYVQIATVLEYRAGFAAEAQSLGLRMNPQQPPRLVEARLDPRADVRLVLGRDLARQYALDGRLLIGDPEGMVRLAVR